MTHVPFISTERLPVRKLRTAFRPYSQLARAPGLKAALAAELARSPNVFHVEHLFSMWAAPRRVARVLFLHHLEATDWEGRADLTSGERFQLAQMRRATSTLLRRESRIVATTTRLREEVLAINPRARVEVVPVTLDASLYEMVEPQPGVVGLIGSMHWHPSRSAALRLLRLWHEILQREPNARLLVAGWNARKYIGHLFPLQNAELVERVDHPRDFFTRIGVLVYPPLRGSGMKIKVLEAMAYGIPVISNEEGLEGLSVEEDIDALLATTDEEFIRRTVELLSDPVRAAAIGRAGRRLVETAYAPSRVIDQLLAVYEELLPNG
jgi:glycosyltransferase involved in cell wall biosynthesis